MKKKLLAFVIFWLFLGVPLSFCFAGGYEGSGLGSRALSMGGAFMGLADDLSAIWWNPAGLAQSEKGETFFTLFVGKVNQSSSKSLRIVMEPTMESDFIGFYPTEKPNLHLWGGG